jgi:hypothetical protein
VNRDPGHLDEFIRAGGMEGLEYVAANEARLLERQIWLPTLEKWLAVYEGDAFLACYLGREIKRLRRMLKTREESTEKHCATKSALGRESANESRSRLRRQVDLNRPPTRSTVIGPQATPFLESCRYDGAGSTVITTANTEPTQNTVGLF